MMIAAAILCATTLSHTDDDAFEKRGRDVLMLEGIAGIASHHRAYPGSSTRDQSLTQAGVLGTLPFARFGYHRFFVRGLSLGAAVQATVTELSLHYGRDATVWGIAPRIGYAATIARDTALWLRAGPSILYGSRANITFGQIALGVDATLVVRLVADFALTLTMFIESGVAGREHDEINDVSRPIRLRTMGFTLGALIAF